MPGMAICMTRPSKPPSRTTRFDPPPRTRMLGSSVRASRTSSTSSAFTKRRAGPPTPSVVRGASGTFCSTFIALPSDGRARLVDADEVLLRRGAEPLLEQHDDFVARELDVACAERDHEIAGLRVAVEPARDVFALRDVRDVLVAGVARVLDDDLARDAVD